MTFEAYARDWLERQNFSKNIRKTTRQSIDYICRAIGSIEISDAFSDFRGSILALVKPVGRVHSITIA